MYLRAPPYSRLVQSFSTVPENTTFPPLEEIITDADQRAKIEGQIKAWNERLDSLEESKGESKLKVTAGGYQESRLSKKGTLGLW